MAVSAIKAVEEVYQDDDFWRQVEIEMAARLGAVTRKLVLEGARAAQSVGAIVDFDAIHEEALYVTSTTESMYWGKMAQTTREGLRQALLTWQEQGLGKRGLPDLIDSIEPLFGAERAERIAVTEATRLFAEGNKLAAQGDPNIGGLEWQTAGDERVCVICGPLDHKLYPTGGAPECPKHVRCRCALIPVSGRYIQAHADRWQGGEIGPQPRAVQQSPEEAATAIQERLRARNTDLRVAEKNPPPPDVVLRWGKATEEALKRYETDLGILPNAPVRLQYPFEGNQRPFLDAVILNHMPDSRTLANNVGGRIIVFTNNDYAALWRESRRHKLPTYADGTDAGHIVHEMGHTIYSAMTEEERKAWQVIWQRANQPPYEKRPSAYFVTDPEEGLAETIAAYLGKQELAPELADAVKRLTQGVMKRGRT